MQKHQVDFSNAEFRKARNWSLEENCVEVAEVDGTIGIRDSKDQTGPVLAFTRDEFGAFLAGAKEGYFDDFLAG